MNLSESHAFHKKEDSEVNDPDATSTIAEMNGENVVAVPQEAVAPHEVLNLEADSQNAPVSSSSTSELAPDEKPT